MEQAYLAIEYFANSIPPLAGLTMERLYESVFCTIEQLEISGCLNANVSTYLVRKNGIPVNLLLFVQEGSNIRVLNETIPLDCNDVQKFAHFIFSVLPVKSVSFHAIRADGERLQFPHLRSKYSEDIVLTLPDTTQEYLDSLGKATRKKTKQHLAALKRTFPTFRCDTYSAEEPLEQYVREIVAFHRARFASMGKESSLDDRELEHLIALTRSRGVITVIRINDRICAGAICTRIGSNYFSHVVGHDPEYDRFRLGTLCCYLTICNCIEAHGREFHFLWGRYEYKYQLRGIARPLSDVVVYRTWKDYLANLHNIAGTLCAYRATQAKEIAKYTVRYAAAKMKYAGSQLPKDIGASL